MKSCSHPQPSVPVCPPVGRRMHFLASGASLATLGTLLGLASSNAQEALRYSLAGEAASESRRVRLEGMPYNLRAGDLRVYWVPSLSLDWNDNVQLTEGSQEDDFILRPNLTIAASYPLTQKNLLTLDVGLGYSHYFDHSELSRWYARSGSQIAFDFFVGDFAFNLHDRFSYTQDATLEPAVAGTGEYGQFQNTAGIAVTWDLQDVTATLGYDHLNTISTEDTFQQTDRMSEMVVSRAGFRLHPELTAGVEGTASFTSYHEKLLNDNQGYSAGLFADYRPGHYFSIAPRAGYSFYFFDQTSDVAIAEDVDAWYADITISHQPTEVITYNVSIGHEIRLGVQSDAIESTYARTSASWAVLKQFSLTTGFSYEHGEESGGNLRDPAGQANGETYDYFGGDIGIGYSRWKRVSMSLNYRFTLRASDDASRDYTQNMVSFSISYRS